MYSRAVLLEHFQLSWLRFIASVGAALVAVWIRHALIGDGDVPWGSYVLPAGIAGALVVLAMWGTWPSRNSSLLRRVRLPLQSVALATGVLLALTFFYRAESYSRATVVVFIPLAAFALFLVEVIHLSLLEKIRKNEDATLRVLIIGRGDDGRRLGRSLSSNPAYLDVVGCLHDEGTDADTDDGPPVLGTPEDLDAVLVRERVDLAIIALSSASPETLQNLIGRCMAADVRWSMVPPILGLSLDRVQIEYIGGLPIVSEVGTRLVGHDWFIKRSFDVVMSAFLLLLLSPLIVITAVATRLTSRGPVIYRQQRIGLNGRSFTLLKFRTMRTDSDTSVHRDYSTQWIYGNTGQSVVEGGTHKLEKDPRITFVGRGLRATSFDEVPQLWNVFRGDMSLVGPRPPIPYEVDRYTEWHRRRLAVPPGITGLWQVTGRNTLSFNEMIKLDLDYIEHWSLRLDISILMRTVPAIIIYRGR